MKDAARLLAAIAMLVVIVIAILVGLSMLPSGDVSWVEIANDQGRSDIAALLAFMGAWGLTFLFTALTGSEYRTMSRAYLRARWIALLGATITLWVPLIAVWIWKDFGPSDLWFGAFMWKHLGGVMGWTIFIVDMAIIVSPVLIALTTAVLAWRRHETKARWR